MCMGYRLNACVWGMGGMHVCGVWWNVLEHVWCFWYSVLIPLTTYIHNNLIILIRIKHAIM